MSGQKQEGIQTMPRQPSTSDLHIRDSAIRLALLGNMSPESFLRDYWQKKPLLVRAALPAFQGLLSKEELIELACRDDAQARLVTWRADKWNVRHGPLTPGTFSRLPKKHWTLLVQDVNHFLPAARELLLKFSFLPHFRLDDLMVSYAPEGGGVGPHFDSYDVFLLQGMGHRLWQISAQQDTRLIDDAPLKILQDFRPEQEWLLEPGDMLYLPPGCAHNGIAADDCMTYSIGFRAPAYQELVTQFLVYLQDHCAVEGMYHDPDITFQPHPGRISDALLQQAGAVLDGITWNLRDIEHFIGTFLTEPKPYVFFDPPAKTLTRQQFANCTNKTGLRLDLRSRMLFRERNLYLNGDAYAPGYKAFLSLQPLADELALSPGQAFDQEALELLYQWYLYGYVVPGKS